MSDEHALVETEQDPPHFTAAEIDQARADLAERLTSTEDDFVLAGEDDEFVLPTAQIEQHPADERVARRPWQRRTFRSAATDVSDHYGPGLAATETAAAHAAMLEALTVDAWIAGTMSLAVGNDDDAAAEFGVGTLKSLLAAQLGTAVTGWAEGWAEDNLSSLDLTDAPDSLASLIDGIGDASADADAEDQAQGAAAWATEAARQEVYSSQGVAKWDSVANANACQICLDKESGGPYAVDGDAARPPYHNGCDCSSVPAEGSSDDSSS